MRDIQGGTWYFALLNILLHNVSDLKHTIQLYSNIQGGRWHFTLSSHHFTSQLHNDSGLKLDRTHYSEWWDVTFLTFHHFSSQILGFEIDWWELFRVGHDTLRFSPPLYSNYTAAWTTGGVVRVLFTWDGGPSRNYRSVLTLLYPVGSFLYFDIHHLTLVL